MGNDILRAVQRPWHDLMKYCCNDCDSTCEPGCRAPPCSCHINTHEAGDEPPDVIEKEVNGRQYTVHGG